MDNITQSLIDEIKKIADTLRIDVLDLVHKTGSGHPGGSLSSAEIIASLYFHIMKIDGKRPHWEDRDIFILSKGHVCPVLYAALARKDFFPLEELYKSKKINSMLQGHPDMRKTPGIEASTGSLGHGLSIAVGIALANKLDKNNKFIYTLIGDGECQEGQIWEAAMAASHYRLNNLIAFVDYNGLQVDGRVEDVMNIGPLVEKWKSFGWNVYDIDGHDVGQILSSVYRAQEQKELPSVIIARTIKGKGVSFMENQAKWHSGYVNKVEYRQAVVELTGCEYPSDSEDNGEKAIPYNVSAEQGSMRDVFGNALLELGEENDKVVVLTADLSRPANTIPFADKFPERFYNVGIAEQNLMGIASGLANAGMIPFPATLAIFASTRACEQIRTSIAYPKLNVKVVGSYAGLSAESNGSTHFSLEDIAIIRSIPNMTVLVPSDCISTREAVFAASSHEGPVYIRICKGVVPDIHHKDWKFEIGKGCVLKEGNQVSIIATGTMVFKAIKAADKLSDMGISAQVIEIHTIKPIDRNLIINAAKTTGCFVTVEEHSIIGGLGSAVSEVVTNEFPVPIVKVGVNDSFAESGSFDDLCTKYGLAEENIINAALDAVKLKETC